jgi:hypothetical protein
LHVVTSLAVQTAVSRHRNMDKRGWTKLPSPSLEQQSKIIEELDANRQD